MEEEKEHSPDKIILVLQKGGLITIIRDWEYPFAPEIYYTRIGFLGVDEYRLSTSKDCIAYYNYVEPKDEQVKS